MLAKNDPIWGTSLDETPKAPLELLWFNDILPALDANDFVQGVLVSAGAIVVYGDSNAGKTFWTTDLALHVASGLPWNGRRVESGGVIYCVLEGGIGFRNRVAAWRKAKGLDGHMVPFAAIPSQINLLDPEIDVSRLIDAIKAAAHKIGQPVKLVVIDTLSRALAGGNENAPEDMGALVLNMDRIREETGAACLFVHHSGKDAARGARGHSLLRAAVDTEIEVVAEEGSDAKTATVVKQRELKKGDVFAFTLSVVELGPNRHAEPVTTCLVQQSGDGHACGLTAPALRRFTGHTKRALEVLHDLVAAEGQSVSHTPGGVVSVPEVWWRERFYDRAMPGCTQEAKQKGFKRASRDLVNAHAVGMGSGRVWALQGRQAGQTRCEPDQGEEEEWS